MKKIILAAALAITSIMPTAALAQDKYEQADKICGPLGELAATVMTARQNGVPMSKMMIIARDVEESIRPVVRGFVTDAFKEPQYASSEYRNSAIRDFSNDATATCYEVFLKD